MHRAWEAELARDQITLDCPYCGAYAGFTYICSYFERSFVIALMRCSACHEGVVAKLQKDHHVQRWIQLGDLVGPPTFMEIEPRPKFEDCPASLPHNVSRPYLQGAANLRCGHFDAAGAMFRKCLETALKQLDPEGKGSAAKRIDELPRDSGVTPRMKEWAHAIRILGNEAVHEEDSIDESEANDLENFTYLFLIYAFTLPAMVSRRFTKEAAV